MSIDELKLALDVKLKELLDQYNASSEGHNVKAVDSLMEVEYKPYIEQENVNYSFRLVRKGDYEIINF